MKKLWKQEFTLEGLNQSLTNTLGSHLGIEFIDFTDEYLEAKMPVDHREPINPSEFCMEELQ